jgi:hypothetical protein
MAVCVNSSYLRHTHGPNRRQGKPRDAKYRYGTSASPKDAAKLSPDASSFIKTPGDHTQWVKGNFSMPPEIVQTLRLAGLSDVLLSNVYSETGYWAKMGNLQFSGPDTFGMQLPLVKSNICLQFSRDVLPV